MGYVLELPQTDNQPHHAAKNPNHSGSGTAALHKFEAKEVDMMPGDWAETGNPTPYELRTTLHTCRRYWHENKQALNHPDCDQQVTLENIKVLEKLHIHLMDYLVE